MQDGGTDWLAIQDGETYACASTSTQCADPQVLGLIYQVEYLTQHVYQLSTAVDEITDRLRWEIEQRGFVTSLVIRLSARVAELEKAMGINGIDIPEECRKLQI